MSNDQQNSNGQQNSNDLDALAIEVAMGDFLITSSEMADYMGKLALELNVLLKKQELISSRYGNKFKKRSFVFNAEKKAARALDRMIKLVESVSHAPTGKNFGSDRDGNLMPAKTEFFVHEGITFMVEISKNGQNGIPNLWQSRYVKNKMIKAATKYTNRMRLLGNGLPKSYRPNNKLPVVSEHIDIENNLNLIDIEEKCNEAIMFVERRRVDLFHKAMAANILDRDWGSDIDPQSTYCELVVPKIHGYKCIIDAANSVIDMLDVYYNLRKIDTNIKPGDMYLSFSRFETDGFTAMQKYINNVELVERTVGGNLQLFDAAATISVNINSLKSIGNIHCPKWSFMRNAKKVPIDMNCDAYNKMLRDLGVWRFFEEEEPGYHNYEFEQDHSGALYEASAPNIGSEYRYTPDGEGSLQNLYLYNYPHDGWYWIDGSESGDCPPQELEFTWYFVPNCTESIGVRRAGDWGGMDSYLDSLENDEELIIELPLSISDEAEYGFNGWPNIRTDETSDGVEVPALDGASGGSLTANLPPGSCVLLTVKCNGRTVAMYRYDAPDDTSVGVYEEWVEPEYASYGQSVYHDTFERYSARCSRGDSMIYSDADLRWWGGQEGEAVIDHSCGMDYVPGAWTKDDWGKE